LDSVAGFMIAYSYASIGLRGAAVNTCVVTQSRSAGGDGGFAAAFRGLTHLSLKFWCSR